MCRPLRSTHAAPPAAASRETWRTHHEDATRCEQCAMTNAIE